LPILVLRDPAAPWLVARPGSGAEGAGGGAPRVCTVTREELMKSLMYGRFAVAFAFVVTMAIVVKPMWWKWD
jgi:hypothetical protein